MKKRKPKRRHTLAVVPQVTVSARPPRMKITPEEAIKRTETFAMERKEQFIAAVRNGKKTSG